MDNDEATRELIATYRAEAASVFAANQAGRDAANRTLTWLVSVAALLATAGFQLKTADVLMVAPSALGFLIALMCNQYRDVTVLGAARAALETRINALLGQPGLIYELAVAPAGKTARLQRGTNAVRAVMVLVSAALTASGLYVAVAGHTWPVVVAYTGATGFMLWVVASSYRSMVQAWDVASQEIEARL